MSDGQFPKVYLYRRIVLAKLFMDGNFSEAIDLSAIAGEAFFSKFHFIRLFKQIYQKTPHQYLTFVRIENAKRLLQSGLSVAEVCGAVGFDGVSTFTKLFKRCVKKTPSLFQQEALLRQEEIQENPLRFIPGCFADHKGWTKNRNFRPVN